MRTLKIRRMGINYKPIGIIRTPFTRIEDMPIQPAGAGGIGGVVEVYREYVDGLKDLEGFSHLILLYHFHRIRGFRLNVEPFLDSQQRGIFATRAPKRPNPIGLSVVKLLSIDGRTVRIENVDMVDGTPLLDIKPYVPEFDALTAVRTGWLERARGAASRKRSDKRFT